MSLDENQLISRGEIYVVKDTFIRWIPDTSQEEKERYVLVLQNNRDSHDTNYPILIVAPITTKAWGQTKQDVWIAPEEGDLKEPSIVKLSVIQPIAKEALKRYHGRVKPDTMKRVSAILAANLGIING